MRGSSTLPGSRMIVLATGAPRTHIMTIADNDFPGVGDREGHVLPPASSSGAPSCPVIRLGRNPSRDATARPPPPPPPHLPPGSFPPSSPPFSPPPPSPPTPSFPSPP